MESAREELARRVLQLLPHGEPVPPHDARQLRNWANRPEDAVLSLEEIAYRILTHKDSSNADAAKQR